MVILFSIQFSFSFVRNTVQFNLNQIVCLIYFSLLQFRFPFLLLLLTSHLLLWILKSLELLISIMIKMRIVDHWIIHHLRRLELIEITWILCIVYLSVSVEVLNNLWEVLLLLLLLLESTTGASTWLMLLNSVWAIFLTLLFVISFI